MLQFYLGYPFNHNTTTNALDVTTNEHKIHALILEFMDAEDLLELVRKSAGSLPEIFARSYFRHLISALDYLHSNSIAHRDIKLDNLLLNSTLRLKLSDFGFSVRCKSSYRTKRQTGTS